MDAARRRLLGLGIALISLSALLWGSWPAGRSQRELKIPSQELQQPGSNEIEGVADNAAQMRLEWPWALRVGDSGVVQLVVEQDRPVETGMTGTGEPPGYNRLVEARLELEGLLPDPDGEITAPLKPGETVILQWALHPRQAGAFSGTLWVHVRFVPNDGGTETQGLRRVLTAQRFELRSTRMLGLDGEQARLGGLAGTIIGMMIFLETFLEWFWRR